MTHRTHAEHSAHESTFSFQTSANGRTWRTVAVGLSVDDAGRHVTRVISNHPTVRLDDSVIDALKIRTVAGLNYRWRAECDDCSVGEIIGWMEDHADLASR